MALHKARDGFALGNAVVLKWPRFRPPPRRSSTPYNASRGLGRSAREGFEAACLALGFKRGQHEPFVFSSALTSLRPAPVHVDGTSDSNTHLQREPRCAGEPTHRWRGSAR